MHPRLQQLPGLIKHQEAIAFQTAVQARNFDTEQLLKGKFRLLSKSGRAPDLKTIFVSNEEYFALTHGKPARLDLKTTGIPRLQRLLYEIPALGKFGTLQSVVEDHIAVSLRGLVLALTQTRLERKAEVESRLKSTLRENPSIVVSFKKSIERVFEQVMAAELEERETHWQAKAQRLLADWSGYYASTFIAFCRRGGVWKPKKKGDRTKTKKRAEISWNFLIQEIFSDDVAKAFEKFWKGFDSAEGAVDSNIRDWFNKLEETLKACPEFQGVPETASFYEMLQDTREKTQKAVQQVTKSLRRKITDVYYKVVLPDKEVASYVEIAMQPTYKAGKQLEGRAYMADNGKKVSKAVAAHQSRVALIRRKFEGSGSAVDAEEDEGAQLSVFESVFEQMEKAFTAKLDKSVTAATEKLKTTADGIITDFNRRYTVDEEDTAKDPEAEQELLNAANNALDEIGGRIKQQLAECKRCEKEGDVVTS